MTEAESIASRLTPGCREIVAYLDEVPGWQQVTDANNASILRAWKLLARRTFQNGRCHYHLTAEGKAVAAALRAEQDKGE